jgi:hypothetical protein
MTRPTTNHSLPYVLVISTLATTIVSLLAASLIISALAPEAVTSV